MAVAVQGIISSYKTNNGFAPGKGSLAAIISYTFTTTTVSFKQNIQDLDLKDTLDFVQSMFIDNSNNPNPLILTMDISRQILSIPSYSQALMPVFLPNPAGYTIESVSAGGESSVVVSVHLLNFPVPATVWNANTSSSSGSGRGVDGSGTITVGGTAQNIFGGVIPATGYAFYNPDASEDLWVSDSTTAAIGGVGSIRVPMNGGWYETQPGYKPISTVSLYGATAGHKFTARRF